MAFDEENDEIEILFKIGSVTHSVYIQFQEGQVRKRRILINPDVIRSLQFFHPIQSS